MKMGGGKMAEKRGSILLLILVMITVVSYVLIRFIERAEVEVQSEGYYVERTNLRLHAWSMLEVAIAVLADVKEIDDALYSPTQGWADPIDYAQIELPDGLKVRYEFIDESSKLGINQADEGSLFLLFDEMGFDFEVSQTLVNVLLDWIDEDDEVRTDGAESREYSTSDANVRASNQPVRSLEELYFLKGYRKHFFDEDGSPNGKFAQLKSVLTHHDIEQVNINSANPLALQTLVGLNELEIDAISDYLKGADLVSGTDDDNYFDDMESIREVLVDFEQGMALSQEISVLTIKVTVQEGGNAYTLIGTLNTQDQASAKFSQNEDSLEYPFLFLELGEEPGMNNANTQTTDTI